MRPQARTAEVLATNTPALFREAVRRAADLLRAGELVALPTETVYGLAANALDSEAVARIFQCKGRPAHNPIIVHVASLELAQRCVAQWPPLARDLATAFWPGPLTLILPRAQAIPALVTAGGATVGVRWPSHPFIQAVIRECGFPLAAPSANLSSRISPTTAQHVRQQLGGRLNLIVDGGPAPIGIESTVLDVSVAPPRLLRPGMIHEQALLAVTRALTRADEAGAEVLKSPGLLRKHYAPRARLVLWSWQEETDLLRQSDASGVARARIHIIAHSRLPAGAGFGRRSVLAHEPAAFARSIYAELHQCDEQGAELIVVEAPPSTDEWAGIADRLNRAAAS